MHAGMTGTPLAERWSLRSLRPHDVADVRSKAAQQVKNWGYEPGDAELLVTEMVTNVIRHAGGRGVLYLEVRAEQLFIAMSDKSAELPQVMEPDWESGSGRGMLLISQLAEDWGVQPAFRGKVVWALLPLTSLSVCYRCARPVPKDEKAVCAGRILQRGKPDLPLVFCPNCSRDLVTERTGDDSGWGVTARCTLVA